ncbi:hypothetical protein JZ751_005515 [Albula glossodonta]|uniref:Uncharacterized protein n=1 Tax=Albula glossodonta TaxID=121402 RepID=A0A8T2MUN0_9TELE|nr:hypothetical protein JZ751_005515 [Albula glossodonta]
MTPPPIHINGPASQEDSTLSHSVSSHLDTSPESSENGVDAPLSGQVLRALSPGKRQQILRGVKSISVKAACRRSRVLEADALLLAPPPSPPLSPLHPRGPAHRPAPSPQLRHASSDDNLSSSTGDGSALQGTWTRPRLRPPAPRDMPREPDSQARRRKRRSRSFEVTGQALSQSKVTVAPRFRPLDSTSDTHLHISGQPPAPLPRPLPRAAPPLTRARPPHSTHPTGSPAVASDSSSPGLSLGHLGLHKRRAHLRPPQPLLYVSTAHTGGPRTRKH